MAGSQRNQIIQLDFSKSDNIILSNLDADITWQKDIREFLEAFWNREPEVKVNTSGSTGKPKTILLDKEKVLASAKMTCDYFDLNKNSTGLLCLSSNHIAGKMVLVRAFHAEMKLYCMDPCSNPLNKLNSTIDFCAMVPYQVRNSFKQLEKIKKLIIGGAPLFEDEIKKLKKLKTESFLTYGMTETISHIAVRNLKQNEFYQCLNDVTIDLDHRKCLTITSPSLIGNEPLITNDICEKIDAKTFIWKGRFDNVINSGGVKLFPEAIEQKIGSLIKGNFYITGSKDDALGEVVTLIYEEDLSLEVIGSINETLEPYEQIRRTYQKAINKTDSGKIIRKK